MRDWELAEHFAERDGVRMSSGQHIDTPGEGPIPWEMVGRWDSLVAKNTKLREATENAIAAFDVVLSIPSLSGGVLNAQSVASHAQGVLRRALGEGE